jgi:lichenan operon transcriptional antiterminator
MDSRHKDLLNALIRSDSEWVSAVALSECMGISPRSVKTRVAEINSLYPDIISSSKKGYRADRKSARRLFTGPETGLPYTPEVRISLILKKLIKDEALDLLELCEDELFVSLETVKKDLAAVKHILVKFDLCFAITDFTLVLKGGELNKRRLFSCFLYKEFNENSFSLAMIEKTFPKHNVKFLYDTILMLCRQRRYFINEYSVLTMLLDILIGIERIKNNHVLTESPGDFPNTASGPATTVLAKDIIRQIEKHFDITYNVSELNEAIVIISSNLIKIDFNSITMREIEKYIDSDCSRLIEPLKAGLDSYGFIGINDQKFMPRFMLHINNLLLRLKSGYVRKNPLTDHIKKSYPVLFDCATALSEIIYGNTGFRVDGHEAAYIALHIGSLLDVHSGLRDKAVCVLLFPGYYDYGDKLIARIEDEFNTSLVIQKIVSYIEELQDIQDSVDLVISVIPVPAYFKTESIYINPFMLDQDINRIRVKIDKIRNGKKKSRLLNELKYITSPKIFCRDIQFPCKEDAIRYMSGMMIQNDYAEETFTGDVLSREKNYSTAYGNIAVPHSMRQDAKKTGMCVLINRRPIPWGQDKVNIVLMFSIQNETRNIFYDVFENIIVLLLEPANRARVMECKNYDEFIKLIIDCL